MLGLQLINWRRVIPWLLQAWSFIALILLLGVYFLCLSFFSNSSEVNKYYGAFLQILGGATVLFAIIENLNIFRSKTVFELVIYWFKSFPFKRHINASANITLSDITFLAELTSVYPTPQTLEDRLKNIERVINDIKENQKQEIKIMKLEIDAMKSEFEKNKNDNFSKINEFDISLKNAMAGDVQSPIFGVLLAIIGTIISLFS